MITRSVAAAAFTGLLVLGPGASPPAAAADQGTTCVQLVISPGALGGATSSACITVKDGANGLDVLRTGGHSLRFDQSGLICAIDGRPATGCGDATTGAYAYWSYWWRTDDGAWRFANRGPGAHPVATTGKQAEGWSWNDGSGKNEVRPTVVPYATTCPPEASAGGASTAPPAPTEAPTRAPATTRPTRPASPLPTRPAPPVTAPPFTGPPVTGPPVTGPPVAGPPVTVTPVSPGEPSAGAVTTTPAAPPSPTAAPTPAGRTPTSSSTASGDAPAAALATDTSGARSEPGQAGGASTLLAVLGVAVGAALLGVAAIVTRRRRSSGPDDGLL